MHRVRGLAGVILNTVGVKLDRAGVWVPGNSNRKVDAVRTQPVAAPSVKVIVLSATSRSRQAANADTASVKKRRLVMADAVRGVEATRIEDATTSELIGDEAVGPAKKLHRVTTTRADVIAEKVEVGNTAPGAAEAGAGKLLLTDALTVVNSSC